MAAIAGMQRIVSRGSESNARCVTLEQALQEGKQLDGINMSIPMLHALGEAGLTFADLNIRIADQPVVVENSGCVPDHHSIDAGQKRVIAIDCPSDDTERCARCIMKILPNGQKLIDSLKESDFFITGPAGPSIDTEPR